MFLTSFLTSYRNAQLLATQVGCSEEEFLAEEEQLNCLQNVSPKDILDSWYIGFSVNVDGEFAPEDAVVPIRCEQTVMAGEYDSNIDLLIGTNTEEGLLMTYPAYLDPR